MPTPLERQCHLCNHAERERADTLIRSGISMRAVAAEFGCSAASVQRHKKHNARTAEDILDAARAIALPKRNDRSALLRGTLDYIADNEADAEGSKIPVLARAVASVRDAADLRSALQLLVIEGALLYKDARSKGNLTAANTALKTTGWLTLVLGKAHAWIADTPSIDARSVNIIGDMQRDDMLALRDMLRDVVSEDVQRVGAAAGDTPRSVGAQRAPTEGDGFA